MKMSITQVIVCLTMITSICFASQDRRANKLFVEAYQLVKEAQEVEKTSYSDAYELYAYALTKLDNIITRHSSSQIAVDLVLGRAKIRDYTIEQFEEFVSRMKIKANAETNIIECALLLAKTIENATYRDWALKRISEAYATTGQYNKALEVATVILHPESNVSALLTITSNYIQDEQINEAQVILYKAFKMAERIDNLSAKQNKLVAIAKNYALTKDFDKAFDVANLIEDEHSKDQAINYITAAYAHIGEYETALELANTIKNSSQKNGSLYHIVESLVKVGKYEEAQKLTEDIEDSYFRTRAFSQIVQAYAKAGEFDRALEITNMIRDRHGIEWDQRHYRGMGVVYAEAGEYEKALDLANKVHSDDGEFSIKLVVAIKYSKTGEFDKAIDMITTIEGNYYKVWILSLINWEPATAVQKKKVLRLLSQTTQDLESSLTRLGSEGALAMAFAAMTYSDLGEKNKGNEILSLIPKLVRAEKIVEGLAEIVEDAEEETILEQAEIASRACSIGLQLVARMDLNDHIAKSLAELAAFYDMAGKEADAETRTVLHQIIMHAQQMLDEPTDMTKENAIVGKWIEINGTETMEFYENGTVVVENGMIIEVSYKFVEEDRIKLELGGVGVLAGPIVARFSISGDELTFSMPDGDVSKYRRVK